MRPLMQPESSVVLSDRFTSRPSPPHFLLASPHVLPPPTMRLLPHENCNSYARCQTENSHRRQDRQKQGLHMQSSCVIILLRECVKCGNGSLSCRWHRVNCGGELWQKQWVFIRGTKSSDDFFFLSEIDQRAFFYSHVLFQKPTIDRISCKYTLYHDRKRERCYFIRESFVRTFSISYLLHQKPIIYWIGRMICNITSLPDIVVLDCMYAQQQPGFLCRHNHFFLHCQVMKLVDSCALTWLRSQPGQLTTTRKTTQKHTHTGWVKQPVTPDFKPPLYTVKLVSPGVVFKADFCI